MLIVVFESMLAESPAAIIPGVVVEFSENLPSVFEDLSLEEKVTLNSIFSGVGFPRLICSVNLLLV